MADLPSDHLVILSSHPAMRQSALNKRQLVDFDPEAVEDSVTEIGAPDVEASSEDAEGSRLEVDEPVPEPTADDPTTTLAPIVNDEDAQIAAGELAEIMDDEPTYNMDDHTGSDAQTEAINAALSIIGSLQTSSPSRPSSPVPSDASLLALYSIVTPNLIFATLLFFLVFFPVALMSISALSSM